MIGLPTLSQLDRDSSTFGFGWRWRRRTCGAGLTVWRNWPAW